MPRWIASTDAFDIEITPEIERMIKLLQESVPSDDVYLTLFAMIYTCDKLLSCVADKDPEFFESMIDEDNDIAQLSSLVFSQLDFLFNQEEDSHD